MLFLFAIGLAGLWMIYFGIKSILKKKNIEFSVILILVGGFPLTFSLINYFGYHQIFNREEKQIVGNFINLETNTILTIESNHKWTYKGNDLPCSEGVWEFQMSEDCNYWNISSYNENGRLVCHDQTLDPNRINFSDDGLKFLKK